jgi:hypothetical protein
LKYNPDRELIPPRFVILSAFFTSAFKVHLQHRGIDEVYEKPIQIDQLREILSEEENALQMEVKGSN